MASKLPGFIVVEGPIGIGKTTLTKRLAQHFNGEMLLEAAEENPFLERFYQDPKSSALPTQLFFLFNRHKQLKKANQSDLFAPTLFADFLFEKDRLFARLTLDEDEYALYDQVYQNLSVQQVKPGLVIYLQAPTEVLLKRIRSRGRRSEQAINPDYLQSLSTAYTDFFYYYDDAPLLIVNSSGLDLVNNEQHFIELVEQIQSHKSGKQYFNPVSI